MPLTVSVDKGAIPSPQSVPRTQVVEGAQLVGNPHAEQALAVTMPRITIDQTGLQYETRSGPGGNEFRFNTGTLRLTLSQEVRIDSALTLCARGFWAQHETIHVNDNRDIMDRMDAEIRADDLLREIFIDRQWFPRDMFNPLQQSIREHVAASFQRLTAEKVRERDTRAEYARVNRLILSGCPDPFHHSVVRGESLWRLAEFYYGDGNKWRLIYDANRSTIGSNPNLIRPGQNLLIPRP